MPSLVRDVQCLLQVVNSFVTQELLEDLRTKTSRFYVRAARRSGVVVLFSIRVVFMRLQQLMCHV